MSDEITITYSDEVCEDCGEEYTTESRGQESYTYCYCNHEELACEVCHEVFCKDSERCLEQMPDDDEDPCECDRFGWGSKCGFCEQVEQESRYDSCGV